MKLTTAIISALLAIIILGTFCPAGIAMCACQALEKKIERVEQRLAYGEQTNTLEKKEIEKFRAELAEYLQEVESYKKSRSPRAWYAELMLKDINRLSLKIARKIKKRLAAKEKVRLSKTKPASAEI